MNTMTVQAAAFGVALLIAAPLAAQQHGAHGHGQHAQHTAAAAQGAGEHMHSPAVRELNHKADLALSAEQVRRLEAIQARMKAMCDEHGPHLTQGMAEMRTLVGGADSAAFKTVAQRQSGMMLMMQMEMNRAYRDARAVLSAEQVAKLDAMHTAHHGAGAAAAGAHAGHGAQAATGVHGAGHGAEHGDGGDCTGMPCCGMPCCADGMKAARTAGAGASHH